MKKRDIDLKDIEIINILRGDAMLTNKDLAKKVDLSEGPTLVRVQNLFEKGVLRGYIAKPNYAYFGYTNKIYVRVVILHKRVKEFIERIQKERKVISCVRIEHLGENNSAIVSYALIILGKSEGECREVLDNIIGVIPSLAVSYTITIIKEEIKNSDLILNEKDCK